MTAPTRPLLRYLGGKWRLAPWIIAHFPPHRIYVEPFGGAGSVLLRKPRSYNEIYNDIDGEIVNLFRVLRSPAGGELVRLIELTPYGRAEYLAAFEVTNDPIERARRMLVRSHFGHGTSGTRTDRQAGFRCDGKTATTNVAGEWGDFADALRLIQERMRGVSLENVPAGELLERYDDPKALIYLDPPYMPETRSAKAKKAERYHTYNFDLSIEDHAALLAQVVESRAMILISGYATETYEAALLGWERRQTDARAHRNGERTEVLWINPLASECLAAGPLFA